jgi:molybdate transport system substrate-binding protein
MRGDAMKKLWIGLYVGLFSMGPISNARAAEVRVLSAGAMRAVVVALQPAFEKQTGHTLSIDRDTAGGLAKRIGGGEAFDVTIITPKVVDDLIAQGRITAGSRKDVAKVGIGVAVKQGAPAPDISTADAFKRTLLAAKSVAYIDPAAGGSSGIYFDKLLERLGIANEIRPKAKLMKGGYVAELVAKGEAEIAVHQISEIVPVKGVTLIGPLPAEIQNITVYAAGLAPAPRDVAAAKALIDLLSGPDAAAVLKTQGMEKP